MYSRGGLAVQQFLHHELGVAHAAGQLPAAAELLQQRQLVGAEVPLLVNVGHGTHQRAEDQFSVVLNPPPTPKNKNREWLEHGVW